MKIRIFADVEKRWSKWHGQRCPICEEGVLSDGVRERTVMIADVPYSYTQTASWCDTCEEGLTIYNPIREIGMEEFLEAQRRFLTQDLERSK